MNSSRKRGPAGAAPDSAAAFQYSSGETEKVMTRSASCAEAACGAARRRAMTTKMRRRLASEELSLNEGTGRGKTLKKAQETAG